MSAGIREAWVARFPMHRDMDAAGAGSQCSGHILDLGCDASSKPHRRFAIDATHGECRRSQIGQDQILDWSDLKQLRKPSMSTRGSVHCAATAPTNIAGPR